MIVSLYSMCAFSYEPYIPMQYRSGYPVKASYSSYSSQLTNGRNGAAYGQNPHPDGQYSSAAFRSTSPLAGTYTESRYAANIQSYEEQMNHALRSGKIGRVNGEDDDENGETPDPFAGNAYPIGDELGPLLLMCVAYFFLIKRKRSI